MGNKNTKHIIYKKLGKVIFAIMYCAIIPMNDSNAATVARRPTVQSNVRPLRSSTASQPNTKQTEIKVEEPVATTNETTQVPEQVIEDTPAIENKESQFASVLKETGNSGNNSSSELSDKIRAERAALDAQVSKTVTTTSIQSTNKCDSELRTCMQSKCGDDFTGCATDTATTFGDKINSCRKNTKCSGHEYSLFSAEILEDRKQNIKLKSYKSIIDCGERYNACIESECGKMNIQTSCLSRKNSDTAIKKCEQIAKSCSEYDNGFSARTSKVFASLRSEAEVKIASDEKRLYELRDQMKKQCSNLGAMFDERTFDCVFTINFFAGDDKNTPKASKKSYAGSTFTCTPDWFGIDVTTYKENAYRETRAQKSASSAMLGSGLGMLTGMATSGAIGRATDTANAKKELKAAEKNAKSESTNTDDVWGNNTTTTSTNTDKTTTSSTNTNTTST